MDLEETASDSKLHKDSAEKENFRPKSGVVISKSDHGLVETTSSNEQLKEYKSWVSNERWNELKKLAETAMREHKVFMIKGGGFPAVRRALVERGWIEKYETHKVRHSPPHVDPKKVSGKGLSKVERLILYKFMEHHAIDFLWTGKRDKYDFLLSNKDVLINRFCRSAFSTKEGLTDSLVQMHWYTQPGVALTRFPRCYNIHNSESLEEFIDDFRVTACISLLKWYCLTMKGDGIMPDENGKVPFSAVDFAIGRLEEYIKFFTHKDIDEADEVQRVWEHEWDQFLTYHYLLAHENAKFIIDINYNIRSLEKKAAKTLNAAIKHWPQSDIDGVLNIWIVKPGNKCRGKGIHLMNNIKDIISLVPYAQKSRYVVQKYIENPLIIYDTKFDIRQWFLVTSAQPLTIWIYKDSYLRFSSQKFSLSNYHESVHLTNNAVQHKYKNNADRDKALPHENMWDCHSFRAYLRQIGKSEMWDDKIYPGMKQSLVGAMLACQDGMDKRQHSFELYGADFMLTEDFSPWLIEINSSPDLAPTTSVTARLCPQCLEDVVKVVLDRRTNPDADTGTFELIYRQTVPKSPAYFGLSLCVNGKKLTTAKKNKNMSKSDSILLSVESSSKRERNLEVAFEKDQPLPPEYNGPIITDLLSWLNPYDNLPTNKEGIVAGPEESVTVGPAITVTKSDFNLNKGPKVRKTTTLSFRKVRRRREKKELKRRVVPHCCCTPVDNKNSAENTQYHNQSMKTEKKNNDKSVGNKRCYIDPEDMSQECGVLRSTVAAKNKMVHKSQMFLPLRKTKSSGVINQHNHFETQSAKSKTYKDDLEPFIKVTAFGKSICTRYKSNNKCEKSITS